MNPDLKGVLILTGVVSALSLAGLAGLAYGAEGDDCDGPLHCFLTRLPRHTTDADEKPLEREQRLREKAEAIKAATPKDTERAWLLMTGTRESHWARFVDLDLPRCRDGHDGRCDGGKAWSVWQLQGTNREGGGDRSSEDGHRGVSTRGQLLQSQGVRLLGGRYRHVRQGGLLRVARGEVESASDVAHLGADPMSRSELAEWLVGWTVGLCAVARGIKKAHGRTV